MDAPLPPVLSLWSPRAGSASPPDAAAVAALARVPGVAADAGAALAAAAAAFPGRDVLLCRAGAAVPDGVTTRLLAAWGGGDWDTLSPLAGDLPERPAGWSAERSDAAAWALGEHAAFAHEAPATALCLVAGAFVPRWLAGPDGAPARHGLLPCAWVDAAEPGEAVPPLAAAPPALAALRARLQAQGEAGEGLHGAGRRPVLLHVLHGWGGGAERFVRELIAADRERQHLVLVARGDDDRAPFGRRLALHDDLDAAPLATWPLARPIDDTAVHSPEVAAVLGVLRDEWGVGAVLVSSLIGHSLDVLRTGLPTALCCHDPYPFWPLLHDPRDPRTTAFDAAALADHFGGGGDAAPLASRDPAAWWALREATIAALTGADALLVAPTAAARDRMQAIAPALAERRWQVLGHGLAPMPPARAATETRDCRTLRVLVPGRLNGHKGKVLLTALLGQLPDGIELVLLGAGNAVPELERHPRLRFIRDYAPAELADWVARLAPDLALLPSTVPETWSFVLSEMHALGVPVLATDLGAHAERLPALGGGELVAPEAGAVLARLQAFAADRGQLPRVDPARPPLAGWDAVAAAWREALPSPPPALRLPAAGLDRTARLAATLDAIGLPARLDAARQELQRRGSWALSLQADLARTAGELATARTDAAQVRQQLEAQRSALSALTAAHREAVARARDELAALRDQHALEQAAARDAREQAQARLDEAGRQTHEAQAALEQAHRLYQRDTADLARQRDVALAARDRAEAERRQLLASRSWRLTRPMRGLRRALQALRYRWLRATGLLRRGLSSLRQRGPAATWRRLRAGRPAPPAPRPIAAIATDGALALPGAASPVASIVVPVYNQLDYTLGCLRALAASGDVTPFEVIVVDDASGDDSARVLPEVPGLRYHRNARNLGFIGACNAGAALARGEFLVFLNNDTEVRPGWLDALLSTFDTHPDTGLAGSRLVYPDGRLQEAGGIVFADGSGWNYGRFEDPAHPAYGFVREVDYCSGAAIALPRALFESLGGFDAHYAPAYYEDTDLAMRVRAAGRVVRYQPASVVVHHEGITSGTDTSQGVKAHQVVNQGRFLERWREVLAREHPAPGGDIVLASEHRRRHRVLVLDACTPTPDRDSGSVRMLALMRLLREQGCAVTFFPENRAHDGDYTRALQRLGIEAWWHPALDDVPRWLARHGHRFDLVIASRHYVLSPLLALLREHAPRARLVFDTVDLHHLRELREAELSGDPSRHRAAARTREAELALVKAVDETWVVSPAERELLAGEAPAATVRVVSNIHEPVARVDGPGERAGLLFVGGFRHPPNVDAARWLADGIFPRIREARPDIALHLVGADAPPEVLALADRPGIHVHGYLPDLGPLLAGVRVALAPLRYGAGVKGKVNQALAHGVPVVATACAVEGMHLQHGQDVLVADDEAGFAEAVLQAYGDDALWRRLSAGGLENTRRFFSPEAVGAVLAQALSVLPPR